MRFSKSLPFSALPSLVIASLLAFTALPRALSVEAPRLVQKDGRYTLLVEGRPYLILGGQIHNSSGWPSELPQVWQSMAALHANTVEAPVYWEQLEPQQGHFDFTNVDQIVEGARAHNLHVVLLWFGTWKNGNMHYVPAWVKEDAKRFPHVIRPDGEPIDVLSPMSRNTLEADKAAFVALTRHLKQIDTEQHTVLLIQVENESGNVGSVRDNSAEANKEFAGPVPTELLAATHKQPGSWSQVFGSEADETFQAYHQAKYINEIAAAGKAEFTIPFYINVWVDYPAAELPQRQLSTPGIGYPSGGAVQKPTPRSIGRRCRHITVPTIHCGFRRPAAMTTMESSSTTRWVMGPSDSRPLVWTRQGGTSWATSNGRRTPTTLRSLGRWTARLPNWSLTGS